MDEQQNSGAMMALEHQSRLAERLTQLFAEYEPSFEEFQWPVESMRWNELAFAILETFGSELHARAAARAMSELDLLEPRKLARVAQTDETGEDAERGQFILGILVEAGFNRRDARLALTTLCEAATAIEDRYSGRVQRLLRTHGRTLVENIVDELELKELDREQATRTIVRWLQNVLNLPVYLERESCRVFCHEFQTTPEELVAAADELDINVALVDELLERWYRVREEIELPEASFAGVESDVG
jgi:hypothetical protein